MLRTEIDGVHSKVDDKLRKYIGKKVGNLDRYVPRHARSSAHAEVKLKEAKSKDKKQCTCEVILHLPLENIAVSETTVNMYAAVDIAEAKLRHALRKYKDKHGSPRWHRRVINRFRRNEKSEDQ
jgi:ribosomal subunit interface protein